MIDADAAGDLLGTHHASRRAGEGHLDGVASGLLQGHLAAVGLDRGDLAGDALLVEPRPHSAQMVAHDGLDVGVGDGGGRALELLPLGQHLVGDADRDVRALFGEDLLRRALVVGGHEGEEEVDGDRLDPAQCPDFAGNGADAVGVERVVDLAPRQNTPVHLVAVAPFHQRLGLDPGDVVVALALAPLDEGDVAKPGGGQVGDRGALALQDRVGRDGGAEADVADGVHVAGAVQPVDNPVDGVGRCGECLPDVDGLRVGIVTNEIGEGSAHVDPDQVAHGALPRCMAGVLME